MRTKEGRLCLFVAFARLHERAARRVAADVLHATAAAVPCRIHAVPTDDGTRYGGRTPTNEEAEAAAEARWAARGEPRVKLAHAFDHACGQHGFGHRATKPAHPWTNGRWRG